MSEWSRREHETTGHMIGRWILGFAKGALVVLGFWFMAGVGYGVFRGVARNDDSGEGRERERPPAVQDERARPAREQAAAAAEQIARAARARAAAAAEAARKAAARPDFVVVDVLADEGCTQIGDYCIRVHCTYQNTGTAAGETEIRAKLMLEGTRTVLAVRTQRLTLMPSRVQRVSFDFREAELDWKFFSRCEVD